ncbi:hypothetical protein [Phycicoccus duodecadis]|uniref:Uncharacterized protein n=1 Tax=Phycicoccus duodecadis TaxID=173053 RepID=A0A2N3YGQ5_9MICO|nr:hypothetical protein [Phycicoccus duodecadis]PKW26019.1 hypothetical protein ATL31_0823 [Phycicoccus duodecadis]
MTLPRRAALAVVAALLALLGLTAVGATASAPARPASPGAGPVVLVGAAGLAWSDIDAATTPTLRRLADDGAVASMTVRAVRSRACAVDGWLTLSAGRRAADVAEPCRAAPPVTDGVVPRWSEYLARARADGYDARPGTLAQRLEAAGACVAATGPGAAVAAADPSGHVRTVAAGAGSPCPVLLVDGGTLPVDPSARAEALRALDSLVSGYASRPGTRLVVAGIGDGASPVRPRAVIATGLGAGELTSASTRQPGLVQLQDLTASLLSWAGADDSGLTGRPVSRVAGSGDVPGAERVADRTGFESRAATLRSVSPQVTGWLAAAYALWCAVAALLVLRGRAAERLPPSVRVLGEALATVPLATYVANLVPWWHAGRPVLAFTAALAVAAVAVAALAVAVGRRRPLGALLVVAVLTLLVLVGDVLTGSGLQLASVFGQNPVVGGRFYGIGNTSYALYGTASVAVVVLVATAGRLPRPWALTLAGVVGLLLTAVEGHPSYGADFGGPPGLLLAGLVVLALAAGVRFTAVRVGAALAAVVLVTAGVAVLDWLRPAASRTHLGEFVQTVLDGGLGDVLGRKLAQNLTNLGSPPLLAVALGTLVLAVALWRARWRPTRAGALVLRGCAVVGVVGFAINDSGLVVPAFVALSLLPLVLADRSADRVPDRIPDVAEPPG